MFSHDLEASTVRLRSGGQLLGSGFWVGPSLVVTCAHVVKDNPAVTVDARGETYTGDVVRCARQDSIGENTFPDFALLHVPTTHGIPVQLDTGCLPGDALHAWGFPGVASAGDSIQGECEGFRNFGTLDTQRVDQTEEHPNHPGLQRLAPVESPHRPVCGMLKRTRDENTAAGGYAVGPPFCSPMRRSPPRSAPCKLPCGKSSSST